MTVSRRDPASRRERASRRDRGPREERGSGRDEGSRHDRRLRRERGSRQERKERTRQALLEAALGMLEHESFGSLSLRRLTRAAGIVPTAFYRHFESMDQLGLELVEESFVSLRRMLRDARRDNSLYTDVIDGSIAILTRHVREYREHFRFILRERFGGSPALRQAIGWELRLFVSELALDLSRFTALAEWTSEDLQVLAELIVNNMISVAEAIADRLADEKAEETEEEIAQTARKQLRMILVGVAGWRP